MVGRIRLAWLAVGRTFGVWLPPVVSVVGFLSLRLAVTLGMALDRLHPRLRRQTVRAPIVVVGNPRSGTTFFQRLLCELKLGAGTPLWRMLYPSLALQVLVRPLLPLLERFSPARHHSTVAHDTNLLSVETEDASFLFRYFDGFLVFAFLLGHAQEDLTSLFDPRVRDLSRRDFAWLRRLWARNLVASGQERQVAKLFSLGARLPAFFQEFPDARVIYLLRDPLSVIPSTLNLVSSVLDQRFGFWGLPEELRSRWVRRIVAGLVQLWVRFFEDLESGAIPRDKVLVVPFDRLMGDLDGVMAEVFAFVGVEADAEQLGLIAARAESQRSYRSGHSYQLERFCLTPEDIRRDCAVVYEALESGPRYPSV